MGIACQEARRIVKGNSKIYIGKRSYLLKYNFETSGNSNILSLKVI
jgi:hypothetical protein